MTDMTPVLNALKRIRRDGEKPTGVFAAAVFETPDGLGVSHGADASVDDMVAVARAIVTAARQALLTGAHPDCQDCRDNAEHLLYALATLGDPKAAEEVERLEAAEERAEPEAPPHRVH